MSKSIIFLVKSFWAAFIDIWRFISGHAEPQPFFVYFCSFLSTMTNAVQNLTIKSADGVLGIQTRDCRMEGTHESTELCRHPVVGPYYGGRVRISLVVKFD